MTRYTLADLLTLALTMENRAYQFYEMLEQRYGADPDFVECLGDVKEDEKLHASIVREIAKRLSQARLETPVDDDSMDKLQQVVDYIDDLDADTLEGDALYDAIQTVESAEFDVVMGFVSTEEVDFPLMQRYLENESVEHTRKVYSALQCIE